jgi:hypothetical protein
VFAADETNSSPTNFPIEYVNSCKGLSEKDSCQVHTKTNSLVTGSCKIKSITADNFDLVCVPEQPAKNVSLDSDVAQNTDQDAHQHKHKRH